MVTIGTADGLTFELDWELAQPRGTADEASRGLLLARIAGAPVWVDRSQEPPRGVSWSMVELLERLSWAWPYLEWEELDPLGLGDRPDRLRVAAERRWESISGARRNEQQRQLRAFEDTHDLARAFQGTWLPPLWILRQGRQCWLVSGAAAVLAPVADVLDTLRELADVISARLAPLADARASAAVNGWANATHRPPAALLAIATTASRELLAEVARDDDPVDFFEWPAAGMSDGSELVAVARMTGSALPPAELRRLMRTIKRIPRSSADALEAAAAKATTHAVLPPETAAYDEGYALARWAREQMLSKSDDDRVDPEQVLEDLGLTIREVELSAKSLDAISVWGPRHGPTIIVNRNGSHARGSARRATLAHELCHALVDRRGALPLGEVLGGRVQPLIEARARAFAAELLVPKSIAGHAFAETSDPKRTMQQLTKRYGASQELVAWQARNSNVRLPQKAFAFLRALVSMSDRF